MQKGNAEGRGCYYGSLLQGVGVYIGQVSCLNIGDRGFTLGLCRYYSAKSLIRKMYSACMLIAIRKTPLRTMQILIATSVNRQCNSTSGY